MRGVPQHQLSLVSFFCSFYFSVLLWWLAPRVWMYISYRLFVYSNTASISFNILVHTCHYVLPRNVATAKRPHTQSIHCSPKCAHRLSSSEARNQATDSFSPPTPHPFLGGIRSVNKHTDNFTRQRCCVYPHQAPGAYSRPRGPSGSPADA